MIVFKTVILRIKIGKDPNQVLGDWGVYIHHFGHPQNAQSNEDREAGGDDEYSYLRSAIHINCGWRQSQSELEFASLNVRLLCNSSTNISRAQRKAASMAASKRHLGQAVVCKCVGFLVWLATLAILCYCLSYQFFLLFFPFSFSQARISGEQGRLGGGVKFISNCTNPLDRIEGGPSPHPRGVENR